MTELNDYFPLRLSFYYQGNNEKIGKQKNFAIQQHHTLTRGS